MMHCRCGFVMCYICRQDVQQQGYQHFCQHFRPLGGACKNCNKCGLYDKEDEEQGNPPCLYGMLMVAIQEARMRATQEYLTRHPNGIISRGGKRLMVAVKAVRVNIRETYMARRHNLPVPLIAQSNSSSSLLITESSILYDCVDFIMEYGKDWLFETYA